MLTLINVKAEDQGEFKCLAVNIPGSWNYRYTLEVTCKLYFLSTNVCMFFMRPGDFRVYFAHSRSIIHIECFNSLLPTVVIQLKNDEYS